MNKFVIITYLWHFVLLLCQLFSLAAMTQTFSVLYRKTKTNSSIILEKNRNGHSNHSVYSDDLCVQLLTNANGIPNILLFLLRICKMNKKRNAITFNFLVVGMVNVAIELSKKDKRKKIKTLFVLL